MKVEVPKYGASSLDIASSVPMLTPPQRNTSASKKPRCRELTVSVELPALRSIVVAEVSIVEIAGSAVRSMCRFVRWALI
jgi:hypothetical protein